MHDFHLRDWQRRALEIWKKAGNRGIVSVVTGGGKTFFALACLREIRPLTTLIVVPTAALLDQWWEEAAAFFDLGLDDINIVTSKKGIKVGSINIAVLNTASRLPKKVLSDGLFLVVDECHKAASTKFSAVLEIPATATLGLSATPERQYDDGLNATLIPALGEVIFEYGYSDALRDGVIVPFVLRNLVFELEPERKTQYEKLTKAIARTIQEIGLETPETVALLLRRARLINASENRVRLALKLVQANRGKRILLFHEDIASCDAICTMLRGLDVHAGVYHSKMLLRDRAQVLADYRSGGIEVLVTCRALDEGFNVPETEIGIIAASTATRRQRIQRLGRVLRPSGGKEGATIFTLIATEPEIRRLREEEAAMKDVSMVTWNSL